MGIHVRLVPTWPRNWRAIRPGQLSTVTTLALQRRSCRRPEELLHATDARLNTTRLCANGEVEVAQVVLAGARNPDSRLRRCVEVEV